MLIIIVFAVLAGAGTALSPCVLPVLPALLSAAGAGGRRRPFGIVLGLALTFTITIVGLAKVVDGVGLGTGALRQLAIAVLVAFGVVLLVPELAARLETPLARLSRLGPRTRGEGFASGLLVGGALGFVYTPCAGPILAAVISVGAATGRTIAVAIAYALGSALVLLALSLGGRRLLDRVRRAGRGPQLQRALGVVMLATGVIIATNLDVKLDQYIAQHIPDVNLSASLESSHAVTSRLATITGHRAKFVVAHPDATGARGTVQLYELGPAPAFTGTQRWFNTPGGHPLTEAALRGRVVLVDFWTYSCINCIRTFPYLKEWYADYHASGLTIVGVHTPEFEFEKDPGNVAAAIRQFGLSYPVVQDNDYAMWHAYGVQTWPSEFLIDRTGHVRYYSIGEGDYTRTETAIRELLALGGRSSARAPARPAGALAPSALLTSETYLGLAHAYGWERGPLRGLHDYGRPPADPLADGVFAYSGRWNLGAQAASAVADAGIDANVQARNVYLVMGSSGQRPRRVHVLLDGRPISSLDAGADVHDGVVTVTGERLYSLVSLRSDQQHELSLRFVPGVSGYAFSFG
ncbi:MAG: cytochrome c biogenesis protein CcdA [Solirubrobacteraceae bacterium]